jgi:predicted lysophospholipase L1 biosynthesis ABC-type transport system permease subunit
MRRVAPWLLVLAGGALLILGVGADPLWPAQDAPAELARRHAAAAQTAGRVYLSGVGLLGLGVAWLALRRLTRRRG